jgi:DNA-binding transcriptional LysR family regulator
LAVAGILLRPWCCEIRNIGSRAELERPEGGMKHKRNCAMRLHAHWIVYLHQVARLGSVRSAARALNVAPSAISRAIKDVEETLGEKLLERLPRGLRLTAAGELVAMHAGQVLRGLDHMEGSLDELRGLRRGHVTVAAVQATAADLFPKILAMFRRTHPRITFTCRFVGSADVAEHVASGEADIGISFNAVASSLLRELIAVPLPFGAIMTPDNPLAACTTLRLHDLADADIPLILPDSTISTRWILDDLLRSTSLELAPAITTSYPDFIVAATRHGAGVAFQTPVGIERELRDGTLIFVPLVDRRLRPPLLSVLISNRRPPSFAASLVAEAVRAGVAELLKHEPTPKQPPAHTGGSPARAEKVAP